MLYDHRLSIFDLSYIQKQSSALAGRVRAHSGLFKWRARPAKFAPPNLRSGSALQQASGFKIFSPKKSSEVKTVNWIVESDEFFR